MYSAIRHQILIYRVAPQEDEEERLSETHPVQYTPACTEHLYNLPTNIVTHYPRLMLSSTQSILEVNLKCFLFVQ